MVAALLGLFVVAFAAACGIAVYRTGQTQPILRALVTFGILLLTPVTVFALISMTLTGPLPALAIVPPVVLLGIGLYTVAEGRLPPVVAYRKQTR